MGNKDEETQLPFLDSTFDGDGKPDCPVEAGTQFTITKNSVPVVPATRRLPGIIPLSIPDQYSIVVTIWGPNHPLLACGEVAVN